MVTIETHKSKITQAREESLHELVARLDIPVSDISIIDCAFTHTSYANEHKSKHIHHNQRLEFLGDAVLDLIIGEYLFKTYPDMAEGNLNMEDFSINIMKYMEENNISQDKLMNIQKKFLERYGFDSSTLENQFNMSGLDFSGLGLNYNNVKKTIGFQEKYKDRISVKSISEYFIKNDKNDLKVLLENEKVILISEKNIDLNDNELNEFLCSYKKVVDDKALNISICENSKDYNY